MVAVPPPAPRRERERQRLVDVLAQASSEPKSLNLSPPGNTMEVWNYGRPPVELQELR